jgi:hypothetical protein
MAFEKNGSVLLEMGTLTPMLPNTVAVVPVPDTTAAEIVLGFGQKPDEAGNYLPLI